MQLFGKEIQLRTHDCSICGLMANPIKPYVNLYVKVTNACNASCPFCSNEHCGSTADFDIGKFFNILDEICRSGIRLNRINLTGGEPSVNSALVRELLDRMGSDRRLDAVQIQINTNLLSDEAHRLAMHPRLDAISISRHHPDGFLKPSDGQKLGGLPNGKVNLSYVLVKGLNDNAETARKMMDLAISNRIPHLGFVELMAVNEYAQSHHVSLSDIDWDSIPGLRKEREQCNGTFCQCSNYVYCSNGRFLDVYMRNYADPTYCKSSLLFDGQYLRQGFQSDNIIF